jgi:hypothetical protein
MSRSVQHLSALTGHVWGALQLRRARNGSNRQRQIRKMHSTSVPFVAATEKGEMAEALKSKK